MLDLTDATARRVLGVTLRELAAEDWRKLLHARKESASQALGRAAVSVGASGLIVRSAAVRRGINIVVFPGAQPEDRLEVIEGAKLSKLGARMHT
jgi:RES domain-containing protein